MPCECLATCKYFPESHHAMKLNSIVFLAALIAIIEPIRAEIRYEFHATNASYFEARTACECRGSELARVDSPEQNQMIRDKVPVRAWIAGNILHKMRPYASPSKSDWVWDGHGPIKVWN